MFRAFRTIVIASVAFIVSSGSSRAEMSDADALWMAATAIGLGRDHCSFNESDSNGKISNAIAKLAAMLNRPAEDVAAELEQRTKDAFWQMGDPTEEKVKELCANVRNLTAME